MLLLGEALDGILVFLRPFLFFFLFLFFQQIVLLINFLWSKYLILFDGLIVLAILSSVINHLVGSFLVGHLILRSELKNLDPFLMLDDFSGIHLIAI